MRDYPRIDLLRSDEIGVPQANCAGRDSNGRSLLIRQKAYFGDSPGSVQMIVPLTMETSC